MTKHFRRSWRPGGLYWRVTLSSFLVTLVAIVTIEGVSISLSLGSSAHVVVGYCSSASVSANTGVGNRLAPDPTLPEKIQAYLAHRSPVACDTLLLASG